MSNLSSRTLSTTEKGVLARGLNFAPAPQKIPVPEIVAAVESGLSTADPSQAHLARTRIVGYLAGARPPPANLSQAEHKALKCLREDDSIVIAPADKGNITVMMDRSDYEGRIQTLLDNTETYRRLTKDPTMAQERKMNGLLLTLMRSGAISERLYQWLRSSAGKVPLLYGLPKVHKPGTPLRPIVSFVNSPTYTLSKHLVTILSPLVGRCHSHVRNLFDFASFIAYQTLAHNMVMVSFDVVSLFTKVPVHLATKVAQDRLLRDTSLAERTSLSADEVINLLSFCLDATYLAYNGDVFQQIFGTAMGSPVSVTVANLVMEDVEERALSTCPHPPPPFWKRYVDDMITALPEDQVDRFLNHLNTVEPSIKFTMEKESNGSLSFLDTLVSHHGDGSLSTSVYRKKTHTDRYLHRHMYWVGYSRVLYSLHMYSTSDDKYCNICLMLTFYCKSDTPRW